MVERSAITSRDLVDQATDWGVTVTEARPRQGAGARLLKVGGYTMIGAASILMLPVLAGVLFFPAAEDLHREILIVGLIVAFGIALRVKSSNLPRNAIQIDYRASEIRLGTQRTDGVFVRQRVAGFREIDDVRVEEGADGAPAILLGLDGATLTLRFNEADADNLRRLAGKLAAARESALRAPIRSRIQSRLMGVEASMRETGRRIRSRVSQAV